MAKNVSEQILEVAQKAYVMLHKGGSEEAKKVWQNIQITGKKVEAENWLKYLPSLRLTFENC